MSHEVGNGAFTGFDIAAGHDIISQLLAELGSGQARPRGLQRRTEMVEHMRHTALTAGEVEREHRPLERPTEARTIGDRAVDLLDRGLALLDHVQGLPPLCLLQSVGDEAGDFAVHADDGLADVGEEVCGPVDSGGRRGLSADDLDQRDEVGRIERMADDEPFGVGRLGGHLGHAVARSRRTDDDVRWADLVDLGEETTLECEIFGSGLLDEPGARDRLGEVGVDRPRGSVGACDHVEFGQGRPSRVEESIELLAGIRSRIPDLHPVPLGEEVRGPSTADRSGADAGDGADRIEVGEDRRAGGGRGVGGIVHRSSPVMVGVCTRRSRISRASSGVATDEPRLVMISTARAVRSAFVAFTPLDR